MSDTQTERIRWEPAQYGAGVVGYVGTADPWLFQIYAAPGAGGWLLSTQHMGGLFGEQIHGRTHDDLKPQAESILQKLVASLGAIFPDTAGDFQVHADGEGDLRLLCPRAEDLGCLFAAEVLSGSTIAQIIERASAHTGKAAEDSHAYIRTINGEDEPGTPPAGEGDQ